MNTHLRQRLAWANFAIVSGLGIPLWVITLLTTQKGDSEAAAVSDVLISIVIAIISLLGAIIVSKRPENLLGLGFVVISLLAIVLGLSEGYANYGIKIEPGSLPETETAAWLANWLWVPVIMPLLTLLFLLCPDGRTPSRSWHKVLIAVSANLVVLTICSALKPGPLDNIPEIENPYGLTAIGPAIEMVGGISIVLLVPSIALCGAAMVQRFRHSQGIERMQLKWFVASAVGALLLFIGSWIIGIGLDAEIVWDYAIMFGLLLVALATTVAILRYRLYDIDRIINRTLVYALLTGTLGALYLGAVVALQSLFSSLSGGNDLAIALTTLLVAALFLPARRHVQVIVDRRFNRRNYDAQLTVDAFSARLRDQIDMDTLRYELLAVVGETMQPERVMLMWTKGRTRD
jgi:hypothetical protein